MRISDWSSDVCSSDLSPLVIVKRTEPSTPSGTTKSTETGMDQLSYRAASSRKTTSRDRHSSMTTCPPACCSAYDIPVHSLSKPSDLASASHTISPIPPPLVCPRPPFPDMLLTAQTL